MATNKDPGIDDVKGIVALAVLVGYIFGSVLLWGFNLSYLLALITFFIVLFGATLQSNKIENGKVIKSADGNPEKEQNIVNILAVIVWILALFIVVFNIYPDYSGRLMFIMFAAAISTSMKPKDIILFLGLSLLTSFFFESGVLATMVLIVTSLFAYACRQNAAFGAIMMVPLLMVGWFVGSGWGAAITQKVDSFSTQMSVTTGISTEGIGSGITSALNDTWLLFTNPNAWYEKQFVIQGNRDEGATSSALEITKIEALPTSVMPLDTFDIMFELENKGTKYAENVKVGAKADSLADNCGKVGGKFCNPACILKDDGTGGSTLDTNRLGELVNGCPVNKDLGKIAPLEKRFESVGFAAPECPGTYTASAAVVYDYVVDATLNLQMISRPYYQQLIQNNKMKWVTEMSTASAGPFKLTLRTDRDQPISDTETDQITPQKFKIYLGLVNEHQGRASIGHATLNIPKELMLVGWDAAAGKYDKGSCSITYDVKLNAAYVPAEDGFTLAQAVEGLELNNNEEKYLALEKKYRDAAKKEAESKNSPFITYRTVDIDNRKMEQTAGRYYKCGFSLEPGNKISQIQTLMMRATLPYTFEYEKSTSVSVRSTASVPAKCKDKTLRVIGAIDEAQPLPQDKTVILNALAQQIYYCYSKQANEIFKEDRDCETFKIDIAGCGGEKITASDIYGVLESNKDPKLQLLYKKALNVQIYFDDYSDKEIVVLNKNEGTEVFNDGYIYQINMMYNMPLIPNLRSIIPIPFPPFILDIPYMTVKYSAMPVADGVECEPAAPAA